MTYYTYGRYSKDRSLFFACYANSLLEADKLLLQATGIAVAKHSDIFVQIF